MSDVESILEAFRAGELDLDAARAAIDQRYFHDVGHSTLDLDRERRTGAAEVIYGEFKTPTQIADAFEALADRNGNVLATRVDAAGFEAVALGPRILRTETAAAAALAVMQANWGDLA